MSGKSGPVTVCPMTAPWPMDVLVATLHETLARPNMPSQGCSGVEVLAGDDAVVVAFGWLDNRHRFEIRIPVADAAEGMSTGLSNDTAEQWANEVALWLSEELDTGYVARASRRLVDGRIELSRPTWPSDDRFYLSVSRPHDRVWEGALWSIARDGLDADTLRRIAAVTPAMVWLRASLNSRAGGPAVAQAVVTPPTDGTGRLALLQVADGAPDSVLLDLVHAAAHQAADAGAEQVATRLNGEALDIVGFRSHHGQAVVDAALLDQDHQRARAVQDRAAGQPIPQAWQAAADQLQHQTRVRLSYEPLE